MISFINLFVLIQFISLFDSYLKNICNFCYNQVLSGRICVKKNMKND